MPKIEIYAETLFSCMGKKMSEPELEVLLEAAKGEIDESTDSAGVMKIELNDTNRPDLWSTAGLGRQLRVYLGGEIPEYPFFSSQSVTQDAGDLRVDVDPALRDVRPYIAAFAVSGKPVDEPALKDLIQSQEKLCTNFGRHRKSIAMGVYRTHLIDFPVRFRAADPVATRFVPLGEEREMNLHEIIAEHPKGIEFGPIVSGFVSMPFLDDQNGEVLSFPPIINSARVGAVEVGDEDLFIELTGTDIDTLLLACSIVACDLADAGHTIHPVAVEYKYDTPYGRTVVTPYYFQTPVVTPLATVERLLGEAIDEDEAGTNLRAMGVKSEKGNAAVTAYPPEYRNDFLHPVDVAEDVMIGRGMKSFVPEMPSDFTIGRLTEHEEFGREAIAIMVGQGFQEMIYPYLWPYRDMIDRMRPVALGEESGVPSAEVIQLSNPMSESYEYVRNSIIPCLLSTEAVSGHAVYPHKTFEVAKVARFDTSDDHGVKTINSLGFLVSDASTGFTVITAHLLGLMYYLSFDYLLEEIDDPRFVPGRGASIVVGGKAVGELGEIHPQIIENWGLQVPCVGCEIDLDLLQGIR